MKCCEYQAKEVFGRYGIPTPKGVVVDAPGQLGKALKAVGLPAVIKAQVLAGGRGKAGGVKVVDTPADARKEAKRLLGSEIKGLPVRKLLVEEKLPIAREYYVGIVTDRDSGGPLAIVSSMGGMNVEEVASRFPDRIATAKVDYAFGLQEYQARALAYSTGIAKADVPQVVRILMDLYRLYRECDAELTEINPLVAIEDGRLVAADGRLNVDDSALYRQSGLKRYREDTLEVRLEEEARIKYVDVGGDIGILSSGAGMTMTVMDQVIEAGGRPANFLDGGMGMLDKAPKRGLELLTERGVSAILLSTYTGGRSDTMAKKFVEAIESTPRLNVPVIVRFQGLNQEEAEKILAGCSYKDLHVAHDIDESARMAVALARRTDEHPGK